MVVVVDRVEEAVRTSTRFLWTTFMRFDPASDLYSGELEVAKNHLVRKGTQVIDARMKAGYPGELFCDDATRRTVDQRWPQYFPEGTVEMGDSDAGHLDQR